MDRLTKALDKELYFVDEDKVQHDENGYFGEAIDKLGKFENVYDSLILQQEEISRELEKLKLEGKTKSVKFKQLLVNKINNMNIITLFEIHGIK